MTNTTRKIDVAEALNHRRMNSFNYKLIFVSVLTAFFDGLDMMMISFTVPYMREELALNNYAVGNIFSAGIVGAVLSGIIMSFFGDRVGRRPTIIVAVIWFGIFTAATAWARSYEAILILRFVAGLAIGGALPLTLVLNLEYAPLKLRATILTIITLGYSAGATVAGPLSVWLAPHFGWQGVFLFGGIGSLICAAILFGTLPESIRFLASKDRKPALIARTLNRLEPGLNAQPSDHFSLSDEQKDPERFSVGKLFAGPLKWLTPLIWLSYLASTLGTYFTTNWGPTLYEELDLSRNAAAYIASGSAVMSSVLGLLLMRFTDRYGPIAIAAYPAVALPLLLLIGLTDMPPTLFLGMLIASITLLGGAHIGLYAISGFFYPSAIRSSGAGWATSIAKTGGILSPIIGGILLSSDLPLSRLFAILAVCPFVVASSLIGIGIIERRLLRPRTRVSPQ